MYLLFLDGVGVAGIARRLDRGVFARLDRGLALVQLALALSEIDRLVVGLGGHVGSLLAGIVVGGFVQREADQAVGVALGERDGTQAFDGGRGGTEEADMLQVPLAGLGIAVVRGRVK